MKRTQLLLLAALTSLVILAGCVGPAAEAGSPGQPSNIEIQESGQVGVESEPAEVEAAGAEQAVNPEPAEATLQERMLAIDLSVEPNEAGQVMVLMYHNIGDEEKTWTRTPDNFRRDLETLYDKGYRPVALTDYVQGTFDIPAGTTPFVITFDDGNENNFRYLETENGWVIDPNCAVGILETFREEHPDFDPQASFFVYGERPFRQEDLIEDKLTFLVENGYEVGNHSWGHDDYKEEKYQNAAAVAESLGKNVAFLEGYLDKGVVNTLALPYGHRPSNDEAKAALADGQTEETEYVNIAILNVGWDPDKSPFVEAFDPMAIHRVRASETNVDNVGLYDWLDSFDRHPNRRYVSDGDPDIVTVPRDRLDALAQAYQAGGDLADHVYVYGAE